MNTLFVFKYDWQYTIFEPLYNFTLIKIQFNFQYNNLKPAG